jgi:hypothetical protein
MSVKKPGEILGQNCLSHGADTVRELKLYMNPNTKHIRDWFHITMRLTLMSQMAKGLGPPDFELQEHAFKPKRLCLQAAYRYASAIVYVPRQTPNLRGDCHRSPPRWPGVLHPMPVRFF